MWHIGPLNANPNYHYYSISLRQKKSAGSARRRTTAHTTARDGATPYATTATNPDTTRTLVGTKTRPSRTKLPPVTNSSSHASAYYPSKHTKLNTNRKKWHPIQVTTHHPQPRNLWTTRLHKTKYRKCTPTKTKTRP